MNFIKRQRGEKTIISPELLSELSDLERAAKKLLNTAKNNPNIFIIYHDFILTFGRCLKFVENNNSEGLVRLKNWHTEVVKLFTPETIKINTLQKINLAWENTQALIQTIRGLSKK